MQKKFTESKGETDMTMEKTGITKEVLQQYAMIMEDWIPKDAAIAIAIGEHYVYYAAGLHDIQLKEGQVCQTRKHCR